MKLAALTICALISFTASAQVKKVDVKAADAFIFDYSTTVAGDMKALSSEANYRAQSKAYIDLSKRAEKLFGSDPLNNPFSACLATVNLAQTAWQQKLSTMSNAKRGKESTAFELDSIGSMAYQAGKAFGYCHSAVSDLTPTPPKECLRVIDLANPKADLPPLPAHCKK